MTELMHHLLALEDRLAQGEFETLLHPDFIEFGLSGRRWTRADVIAELPPATQSAQREHLELHQVGPDLVLLTCLSHRPGRPAAWRSSLWQRSAGTGDTADWQMRFHQATPAHSP
jgi:hypothetical protein